MSVENEEIINEDGERAALCPGCEEEISVDPSKSWECPHCEMKIDPGFHIWKWIEKQKAKRKKKKKDTVDSTDDNSVRRFDSIEIPHYLTRAFERTKEGFLEGRAIVTNIGVFTYQNADGSTHTELRLPEEVFDYESVETLKMKPVTNLHPSEIVTPDNVKQHQVGTTGSNPGSNTQKRDVDWDYSKLTDGLHLAIDLAITEKQAIEDVLNGKQSLSCGYTCELEPAAEGAMWCGQKYDFIQRKIRYNHVAIVPQARAGDAAKIRLDSSDAIMVSNNNDTKNKKGDSMEVNLKKITLDSGVEYQAEAPVLEELSKVRQEKEDALKSAETLTTEKSTLEAERDSLKEKNDGLEKEVEKLKADSANTMKISDLLPLLAIANKAGVEVKADMDEEAIQKAIILKASPNANLDGKDAAYLTARFDSAVEQIEAGVNVQNENILHGDSGFTGLNGGSNMRYDSGKARERMIARQMAESRGEKFDEKGAK